MTIIKRDPIQSPTIRKPISEQAGRPIIGCIPQHPPIIKLDQDRFEFSKRDRNHDGSLSKEEFGTSRTHSRYFADYDLDKDGKLSYDEFNNGHDFDRLNGGNPLAGEDVLTSDEYGQGFTKQYEFFRYDSNHDGKLTREEFAAGRAKDDGPILRPLPFPVPKPFPKPSFPVEPRPLPFPVEPPVIKYEDLVEKVKQAQQQQP